MQVSLGKGRWMVRAFCFVPTVRDTRVVGRGISGAARVCLSNRMDPGTHTLSSLASNQSTSAHIQLQKRNWRLFANEHVCYAFH